MTLPARHGAALRGQAAACPTLQEVLDAAATAEALAVTFYGVALARAADGDLELDDEQVRVLTAARAEEQAHHDFLVGAGAQPATQEFTVAAAGRDGDPADFLKAVIDLEEALVGAYLAAAQELTILGEPELAGVAMQIGTVEAEHRALARFFALGAGAIADLPNDVAFAPAPFEGTLGALDALRERGWIEGRGRAVAYPGPGEIDPSGVVQLEP